MSNGTIDAAQVEAILGGGQDQVNRYVVTTLEQLIVATEAYPTNIAAAVHAHGVACRRRSRRTLYGFIAACGTCAGLATPYILKFIL